MKCPCQAPHEDFNGEACTAAAAAGQLDILKWLVGQGYKFAPYGNTFRDAAEAGRLEVSNDTLAHSRAHTLSSTHSMKIFTRPASLSDRS